MKIRQKQPEGEEKMKSIKERLNLVAEEFKKDPEIVRWFTEEYSNMNDKQKEKVVRDINNELKRQIKEKKK